MRTTNLFIWSFEGDIGNGMCKQNQGVLVSGQVKSIFGSRPLFFLKYFN